MAQENLIKASKKMPYTILKSTQFFEFVGAIVQSSVDGDTFRLPPALFQPVASDDVAAALARIAVAAPANATIEIAGPDKIPVDEIARWFLAAKHDPRLVIADVRARYFGAELDDKSLTPGDNPILGSTRFEIWLGQAVAQV